MRRHDRTSLLVLTRSGATIDAQTCTSDDAEALADAPHGAQPSRRMPIAGYEAVFSREGKVVDLVRGRARVLDAGQTA